MELAALVAGRLGRRGTLVALESGARNWTYRELDRITQRRAAQLRRICPEGGRVVLIGDHTAEALIWALAVMRSGLVHTPLNPVLPPERMRAAIRVAAPSLVLRCRPESQAALAQLSPAVTVLRADEVAAAADAAEAVADTGTVPAVFASTGTAYSIFTSGSTGVPKLVNVGQAGIENLCRSQARIFGVKQGDRVLQFSSLSFDASIAEILVALYAGARLVVPSRDRGSWLGVVRGYLRKNGCDIITLPPSVYSRLDDEARKAIGTVVFAGEALSEVEFRAAARYSRVLNAYGPTEGTVCFSIAELSDFTTSIGRPIEGFTAWVYDRDQGSYTRSGRGESVLVGQGVALGYEGLPALPAGEASPFTTVNGRPAYHSGDHVELSDGELFYLGRQDEQVKRLGHRIELAELSGRIARLLDAPVMLLPDGTSLVLAHTAIARSEAELKARLREQLPPWEVPDVLLALPELPLTDNGKADKAAVRALLEQAGPVGDNGDDDEAVVQAVVADVLGPGIEPAISIFNAGADSLALVRIQVKLSEIYGQDPVQFIFDRLNYDFSVTSFVTGLRGGAQDNAKTRDPEPASVYATISAELAGLPAALSALRPSPAPAPARQAGRREAITLTGASGFIGGHLLDRLLDDHRHLTVVTMSDPAELVAAHCARFERDPADLGDVEFLSYEDSESLAGSPADGQDLRWGPVVHCGFEVNHLLPLTRQLNGSITSTRTLIRAAAARDAPRFVFLSAASAGPRFLPLTEAALAALRDDPYSQSKLVAEEYARALTGERCRVDLLRAGLVYGHTSREQAFLNQDVFAQLLRLSLRHGALPRLQGYVPVCHVDDVVTALLTAADSAGAARASVLVQRTYGLPDLLAELDLRTDQVTGPQDWLTTVTRSQAAEPSLLAALRQWLSATGWSEHVGGTDRPVIAELRQRHLKNGS